MLHPIRSFTVAYDAGNASKAIAVSAGMPVSFGIEALDSKLGGGLVRGGLHELFAASVADGCAALALAAMLMVRAAAAEGAILWVREDRAVRNMGSLHAPGLAALGGDPARMILVVAPDILGLLRAAADSIRSGEVAMVVIEPAGKAPLLDLTASRRLAQAAVASGVFVLAVRVDAAPMPSAAHTRWQVAAAPSSPLLAGAPGAPAFDIALLRQRGGNANLETRLEWNSDTRSFAPLSGGISAAPAFGTAQKRAFEQRRAA
jgi:protein ImuA